MAFCAAAQTEGGCEPMVVCSRCDLFQTGATSTPCCGQQLKGAQLRLGLMGEAVADAKGVFFNLHNFSRSIWAASSE